MNTLRKNTPLFVAAILALALLAVGGGSEANAQSFAPNPPLTAGCGLDVVLMLDGSGSLNNLELQQVRNASIAFIEALEGTGSRVALVEFASSAKLAFNYIDATSGYTSLRNYLLGVYPDTGIIGVGTNWQAAFDRVNTLSPADLVLFITDGVPTQGSPSPLQGAIASSNFTKANGAHIFALGVGLVEPSALDNLKAVLNGPGSVAYDGTNFPVADYFVGTFDSLASDLTAVAYELCAPSLTVTKLVDSLDGLGYRPAEDWEFSGQVTAAGGYDWASPATPDGDGRSGSTGADGMLAFQWNTTDPLASSTVAVAETLVDGYDFVDVTCEVRSIDNQTPAPLAVTVTGTSFEAVLGPDDIASCTVRNVAQPATIHIQKATDPAGGAGFGFTSDIPLFGSFILNDGDSITNATLAAGTYTVTEDDPGTLYALANLECVDPDNQTSVDLGAREATIDLDPGETVSCTFTNQRQTGTVLIDKVADNAGATLFAFFTSIGGGGGGYVDFDLLAGESIVFTDVPVGSHTVGEYDPSPLYALGNLECTDPDNGTSVDLLGRTADIDLDALETVSCTFTNKRQTGSVIIEKASLPAGGTGFRFETDMESEGGENVEFDLNDGDQYVVSDLLAGSYFVTELAPPNHQLIDLTCDDPGGDSSGDVGTRTASIELAVDETVTCTFTNEKLAGTVIIEKLTNTGLGTDFAFSTDILGGGGGYADFSLDAGESVEFSDVPVGSWQVIEYDPNPDYALSSLVCDDPTNDSSVDESSRTAFVELSPSETVTCTFTNNDPPPVAEAGGPYTGYEGAPVDLDGSGSTDNQAVVLYEWDCTDDGVFDASSANPGDSTCTYAAEGTYTVRLRVSDTAGQTDEDTATVEVLNADPEFISLAASPAVINENDYATVVGSFTDPSPADTHTVVISWGDGSADTVINLTGGERDFSASHQYLDDDPTATAWDVYDASASVTDAAGNSDSATTTVTVNDVAPDLGAISITSGSAVIAIGEAIDAYAEFSDAGTLDTHTATWDWGDGSTTPGGVSEAGGSGSVAGGHAYTEAGVYAISLELVDDDTLSDNATLEEFIVVYDPSAGFVTGGGWIYSEGGACQFSELCAGAEGQANFGFVSKYKRGAQVPTGSTEFNFSAGGFNFHSDTYDWLVVNQGGQNAQFKGWGTINGSTAPTGALYGFMIWAQDLTPGSDDTFRIKIWYEDAGAEIVVYDNGFDQAISGGSIVIHTGGN